MRSLLLMAAMLLAAPCFAQDSATTTVTLGGTEYTVVIEATDAAPLVASARRSSLGPDSSFKDSIEALFAGEFDDELNRRQLRRKRVLKRQYSRARDKGEFLDTLLTGIEQDRVSAQAMPQVFGSADFTYNTPMGLTTGGIADLLDVLLERWPEIIDMIKLIIDLFSFSQPNPRVWCV